MMLLTWHSDRNSRIYSIRTHQGNYHFVVAYGDRTGGRSGYNDSTVEGMFSVSCTLKRCVIVL